MFMPDERKNRHPIYGSITSAAHRFKPWRIDPCGLTKAARAYNVKPVIPRKVAAGHQ
jgi:hypothetical protein